MPELKLKVNAQIADVNKNQLAGNSPNLMGTHLDRKSKSFVKSSVPASKIIELQELERIETPK